MKCQDAEKYIYPYFKHLEPTYKVKISGKNWVDLSDDLANKGHAIKLLQNKFNIPNKFTFLIRCILQSP